MHGDNRSTPPRQCHFFPNEQAECRVGLSLRRPPAGPEICTQSACRFRWTRSVILFLFGHFPGPIILSRRKETRNGLSRSDALPRVSYLRRLFLFEGEN